MSDWVIFATIALIVIYKLGEQALNTWADSKSERESDTYSMTERSNQDEDDWEDRQIGFRA